MECHVFTRSCLPQVLRLLMIDDETANFSNSVFGRKSRSDKGTCETSAGCKRLGPRPGTHSCFIVLGIKTSKPASFHCRKCIMKIVIIK